LSSFPDNTLYEQFTAASNDIAAAWENRQYSQAIRLIMKLADAANQYIDENKPWELIKQNQPERVQQVCTLALNLFRVLTIYLKPVLPQLAIDAEQFFNIRPLTWNDLTQPLLNHTINSFKPLMNRIDAKQVEKMIESNTPSTPENKPAEEKSKTQDKQYISIDDFAKVDLRIAKIVQAEAVEGADKLV